MWGCPDCGKQYPRKQVHSCVVVPLEAHFEGRPRARALFDAFVAAVEDAGGPARLSIAKTRIGFITEMTFAAIMPRKTYLRGHLILRRRIDSPKFSRIDDLDGCWVHHFTLRDEADLDSEFRRYLAESHAVGRGG